jgi:hypothetical protein
MRVESGVERAASQAVAGLLVDLRARTSGPLADLGRRQRMYIRGTRTLRAVLAASAADVIG